MKYILFDWNGTLVNDLDLNIRLCNILLKRRNLPPLTSKEFYLEHFDFPIMPFYTLLGFDLEKENFDDIAVEYGRDYAEIMKGAKLFDDVIPLLEKLKADGYILGIVSASMQEHLLEQTKALGVFDYFDAVLGAKDSRGDSKVGRCIQWFEKTGANPDDVFFVGDTVHDAETAIAAGAKPILVSRGHNSRKRLETIGCPVTDNLLEILNLI